MHARIRPSSAKRPFSRLGPSKVLGREVNHGGDYRRSVPVFFAAIGKVITPSANLGQPVCRPKTKGRSRCEREAVELLSSRASPIARHTQKLDCSVGRLSGRGEGVSSKAAQFICAGGRSPSPREPVPSQGSCITLKRSSEDPPLFRSG